MQNEEYFHRYQELKNLIFQGLVDFLILQNMETYNKVVNDEKKALPSSSFIILKHFCDLVKKDYALVVCKLFDSDSNANTIESFKQFVFRNFDLRCTKRISPDSKRFINNDLRPLRNRSIAHNDIQKNGLIVDVSPLKSILLELIDMLNDMCYSDKDDRVEPIKQTEIDALSYRIKIGSLYLIEKTVIPIKEEAGDI